MDGLFILTIRALATPKPECVMYSNPIEEVLGLPQYYELS